MQPSWVHDLAWVTVILCWGTALVLSYRWYLGQYINPLLETYIYPWLFPSLTWAWNKSKETLIRLKRFWYV